MLRLSLARPILAAALVAAMLTPTLTDPARAQGTLRHLPAGPLNAPGCATQTFTGFSGGLAIGRAQNRAERRWVRAVREAGYRGQRFEDWQTGDVHHAYCQRDGAFWDCFLRVAPCRGIGPDRGDGRRGRPHPGWERR
ncbi:MAG: hypothetical protein ACXIVG_05150 [Pararhodobacter sp.]